MYMDYASSSSSSSDAVTINAMDLPILRFGFEENGDVDRGSKGKEKAGTSSEDERATQMYARESECRVETFKDLWKELCMEYDLKDVPHHLELDTEQGTSRRIVKHESTASTSTTMTASSSLSSTFELSEPLSPATPNTDITEFDKDDASLPNPPFTGKSSLLQLTDCDDCDVTVPTVPP
ncbi:hypothetical protein SCHPADRAFT_638420 [Schizopora paradoxa]|uniref:Uncharacterized protein n=1 Tax=Schizopora paradoxa TaxID=27342 RepID=A0A0H2R754_9AGAM|nr:hypothetical protein SCHPADRAFT_638420 [Schizopora paradoxa]